MQDFVLLRGREKLENLAVLLAAINIGFADCRTIDFLRRQPRLKALLRRALQPWPHAVVAAVRSPGTDELLVDEISDARLLRPRSQFIRGYQPGNRRIQESDFRLYQVAIRMCWRRHWWRRAWPECCGPKILAFLVLSFARGVMPNLEKSINAKDEGKKKKKKKKKTFLCDFSFSLRVHQGILKKPLRWDCFGFDSKRQPARSIGVHVGCARDSAPAGGVVADLCRKLLG